MSQTISIATWNVNSVKSRLSHLLEWLDADKPDVVLLQEIKCVDEAFPAMEVEERGYNIALHGQKSYNGVAILSRLPLDDVSTGLPGMEGDEQARYIEGVVSLEGSAIRVASIYLPNGSEVGSDKFAHKMQFFEALKGHAKNLLTYDEKIVLGGDYNVGAFPCDVYDPAGLDGGTCFHPDERAHFRTLLNMGYTDAFRATHPLSLANQQTPAGQYTFWDYRANSFAAGKGWRIDYLMCSPQAADCLSGCEIHKDMRAKEKASDHAPVVAQLKVA